MRDTVHSTTQMIATKTTTKLYNICLLCAIFLEPNIDLNNCSLNFQQPVDISLMATSLFSEILIMVRALYYSNTAEP